MTTQPPTFETFAIVELFGHSRIAGRRPDNEVYAEWEK